MLPPSLVHLVHQHKWKKDRFTHASHNDIRANRLYSIFKSRLRALNETLITLLAQ